MTIVKYSKYLQNSVVENVTYVYAIIIIEQSDKY